MADRPPDSKTSLKKVKNTISRLFKHSPSNSVSPSPAVTNVPADKSSGISSTLDLTNTRNDSKSGVKLNNDPQASDAAPLSTTSHPQAVSDSTSTKAQVESSSAEAPNDGSSTQAKQAQSNAKSAADTVQNPSPDENRLADAPDIQWEELWTRARHKLATEEPHLVEEYLHNLAKRPEFQSCGQFDGFTINSESVMSIVESLDKERTDKQWRLKWKTN